MADVNYAEPRPIASPLYLRDEELKQGVDLLFHAFSGLFAEGEEPLRKSGLGRAHHRALHFIGRNPAISITELLEKLRITKQSLNRVLNDLLEQGYVERHPAPNDRRVRLLRLTQKGGALDALLWDAQRPKMARAFREAGPEPVAGFGKVLAALAGPESNARGAKK